MARQACASPIVVYSSLLVIVVVAIVTTAIVLGLKNGKTQTDVTESPSKNASTITPAPSPPNDGCINLKPITLNDKKAVGDDQKFIDSHYFPFLSNDAMTFENAISYCASFEGYTLAGFNAINSFFLDDTKKLLLDRDQVTAHWLGGYFNVSGVDTRHIIYWLDGNVSDADQPDKLAGGFPQADFLKLNELNEGVRLEEKKCDVLMPIVRDTTNGPLRIDEPAAKLHALCMKKEPSPFMKNANNKEAVTTRFIQHAFNYATLNFTDTKKKLNEIIIKGPLAIDETHKDELRNLWPVHINDGYFVTAEEYKSELFVGWAQAVSYNYAEKFCSHVKFAEENTDGYLLGKRHLMQIEDALGRALQANKNFERALQSSISSLVNKDYVEKEPHKSLRIGATSSNVYLATGARFYFMDGYKFNDLYWKEGQNEENAGPIENLTFNIGWCEGKDYLVVQDLEQIYNKFKKWREEGSGKYTTGPYIVPIAINALDNNNNIPCLRLVPDILYWPTSRNFVPVCEKSAPRV